MLQGGGEEECRMNKAHLPAVGDVWLLDKEHWFLLSPDLRDTVAGASAPSYSVLLSLVAVPALSHTAAALGSWPQGKPGTLGLQRYFRMHRGGGLCPFAEQPAMLPVVQENCFQALLVCILTYQEEHVRSTACFHARHFHHL